MTLSITEAQAINAVLTALFGDDDTDADTEALHAAHRRAYPAAIALAEAAYRRLGAGLSGTDVRDRWGQVTVDRHGPLARLRAIAMWLVGCEDPLSPDGPCPCGRGPWPCDLTQARWLAMGYESEVEIALGNRRAQLRLEGQSVEAHERAPVYLGDIARGPGTLLDEWCPRCRVPAGVPCDPASQRCWSGTETP